MGDVVPGEDERGRLDAVGAKGVRTGFQLRPNDGARDVRMVDVREGMAADLVSDLARGELSDQVRGEPERRSIGPGPALSGEPVRRERVALVDTVTRGEREVSDDRPGRRHPVDLEQRSETLPADSGPLDPADGRGRQVVKPPPEFGVDRDDYRTHVGHHGIGSIDQSTPTTGFVRWHLNEAEPGSCRLAPFTLSPGPVCTTAGIDTAHIQPKAHHNNGRLPLIIVREPSRQPGRSLDEIESTGSGLVTAAQSRPTAPVDRDRV